ncbi:homocysteine-responsive endoplasmic reticulum-resident ubiquitin-like domain member 1 protein [Astyanax mexicanus]|uniref:Homocysteine inducible ER protein with ubiquitin like domain 1 n=1 Tax=Astyanax mexicanus TaxID=7994 RepID=A0A8B9KLP3_ASTMX|nr:homocysteine-responsive endoplasmic reticulum-resident ubiquitin-like domain member 1 protein [Astyanax mexicanus]
MEDLNVQEKGEISLVVKTPNQIHGDQLVEGVNINWTVKDLKTHLTRVYPSKPPEKDQRLIYSGKLLPDHLHIKDIFRQMDTVPIIHLVCAFKPQPGPQQGAIPKVKPAEQQPSSASAPAPARQSTNSAAPAPSVPTVPSTSGLRQRGHLAPAVPHAAWPATGTGTSTSTPAAMNHPAFPTYSLYSPQQLLWLQHMYARQYYMQYQAAMAAATTPVAPPAPSTLPVAQHQAAVPAALPNQGPIDNLPANQNAPDPAFINPEGANQNLRMNAQGGPVMEDEDDVERDWLDWVYTASRFAVFLSIVYFYSNLSRFILVMSSLFLMYLHTAGWFPFRHRAQARVPNQPAPAPEVIQNQQNLNLNQEEQPEPVAAPAEAENTEEAETEAEAEEEAVVQPSMTAVPVSPVRPPILWTAWIFFKAFFASLIPEVPQGVAN